MISERKFEMKKNGEPKSICLCRNPELIENYDKAITDATQMWECHHRLETHNSDGERRIVDITEDELKALGMYYNRPADELIFLTKADHNNLHHKGKKRSEETRKKMSKSQKGKNTWMKGRKLSEEYKKSISNTQKLRMKEISSAYKVYKLNGGAMSWSEFQKENK